MISPNGKMIAFNLKERRPLAYTPKRIAVMNVSGKNIRILTNDLDGDAENIIWSQDNQSIHFTYDQRGIRKIGKVGLNGDIKNIASNVGGTTIGRPYISGDYHLLKYKAFL